MPRHAASRPSRSRRAAGAAGEHALARVSAVLAPAPAAGGWQLPPPAPGAPAQPAVQAPPGALAGPELPPVPAPDQPRDQEPGAAQGVLGALRSGRLDVTPRGAVGLGLLAVLCCALAAVLLLQGRPEQLAAPVVERAGSPVDGAQVGSPAPTASAARAEVVVAVAGDVQRPGLVRLPSGSRVADAVAAAGGVLPGAEAGLLNLARVLVDGEQVVVGAAAPPQQPAPGGAAGGASGAASGAAYGGAAALLDLNQATLADLDALPGIGPVLAERILAHRTEHGPFRSAEQLREVEGIGPATWESLRDLVRV